MALNIDLKYMYHIKPPDLWASIKIKAPHLERPHWCSTVQHMNASVDITMVKKSFIVFFCDITRSGSLRFCWSGLWYWSCVWLFRLTRIKHSLFTVWTQLPWNGHISAFITFMISLRLYITHFTLQRLVRGKDFKHVKQVYFHFKDFGATGSGQNLLFVWRTQKWKATL